MKKRLLSCITALGLAVCGLSAVSSNAYYWGVYDELSEQGKSMFQEEIKDAVKVDNGGMITNFYGNKIEDFYVEPDFNTFVITVKESHI